MIEVKNLTKTYPGVVAVDDVSFTVERGEIVGFLGPNGAGKTTTMRMLTCFVPPTSGMARVAGFDVVRQSLEVRRRVGYLPENNPLYTEMRVGEYINFRAKIKQVPSSERKKRVGDALERCGLTDVRSRIIGHLSKGYRQRVGLADAIVHNPEIVILDEPTIGLDPNQIRQVRGLIKELGKKHTVILSTHILSEVEIMCNRVMIINKGGIVASGTQNEIVRQVTKGVGRVRLEVKGDGDTAKDKIGGLESVERVSLYGGDSGDGFTRLRIETKDGVDVREGIYNLAVKNNWAVRELAFEKASLEDAFVELTGVGKD